MIARVCSSASTGPTPQAWLSKVLRESWLSCSSLQRDVGQTAQTGVDAIGALAACDDALDDALGVFDARPGVARQLQMRAMTGDGDHVLPTQGAAGDNDFFSLGHLEPHTEY